MSKLTELDETARQIMDAIYRETGGNLTKTVGMWALGQKLGLDRARTEDAAMALVGEGLIEIKSLSGGLALTEDGKKEAAALAGPAETQSPDVAAFIQKAFLAAPALGLVAAQLEDFKIDLETFRLQQQRSRPLPSLIESLRQAIKETLQASKVPEAAQLLKELSGLRT